LPSLMLFYQRTPNDVFLILLEKVRVSYQDISGIKTFILTKKEGPLKAVEILHVNNLASSGYRAWLAVEGV